MHKILLISMPFNSMRYPPLHIASLKSYLNSQKISTDAVYFYLRCPQYLGLRFYNFLRATQVGDMLYIYLLFPEQREKIQKAFLEKLKMYHPDKQFVDNFSFYELLKKLREFNEEILNRTPWGNYDLVGFYCYYQQFLPSLYLSKCIKEKYPHMKTVFGGLDCNFDLGKGILATFPYVDFTINGEPEESLAELYHSIQGRLNYTEVKNLTYRKGKGIEINPPCEQIIELDRLPFPDYTDFFLTLKAWPEELLREYCDDYFLQVEFARGCWWRRCSFCTLNAPCRVFREKSPDRIVDEVAFLIKKHQTLQIVPQQFTQPKKWREIMKALKSRHPGLTGLFCMNFRIQGMAKEDYRQLKQYGAKVLFGIESLSTRYLKKMNKGTTAIENIEALKFCEEHNLVCFHNILHGYPNEDDEDFEETRKAIEYVLHLPPPFDIETLRLTYNSTIFKNPQQFGIKAITFREEEKLRYPLSILKTFKPFFYDCIPEKSRRHTEKDWEELIQSWRDTYYKHIFQTHVKQQSLLIFQEDRDFINIVDQRGQYWHKYTLLGTEKDIYLFCDRIRTKGDIYTKFPNLQESELEAFTTKMDQLKLIFIEGEKVLSLALRLS